MVRVTFVGPISEAAGVRTIEANAGSVGDLLDQLCARYGPLFAKRAKASRIVVNGSPIQFLEGTKTALREGDEVALLVPVGGG